MGDDLKSLLDNTEFVVDLCRFAENLASEAQIRKKYRLSDASWETLGANDTLVEQTEAEKLRRERLGLTARERAQRAFSRVPTVLDGILNDDSASPRHRIESAKELRVIADNGPEATPAADIFRIVINLGGDQIKIDKALGKVDPHDGEVIDGTHGLLPVIAARKREDDGSGEPV